MKYKLCCHTTVYAYTRADMVSAIIPSVRQYSTTDAWQKLASYQTTSICNDNDWTFSGEIVLPLMSLTFLWPPSEARLVSVQTYLLESPTSLWDPCLYHGRLRPALFDMQLYNYATSRNDCKAIWRNSLYWPIDLPLPYPHTYTGYDFRKCWLYGTQVTVYRDIIILWSMSTHARPYTGGIGRPVGVCSAGEGQMRRRSLLRACWFGRGWVSRSDVCLLRSEARAVVPWSSCCIWRTGVIQSSRHIEWYVSHNIMFMICCTCELMCLIISEM